MIIISFTISISWIKYSYNSFRLKNEEIVDMIEGSVLLSVSVSFLLPSCEEIPPEALPASDTISSPKTDMPASEPFISKGTIEHSANCEFLLKIYPFFFVLEVAFIDKTYLYPNALRSDLRTNLSLNADVSENALQFVSQSINNLSDYDISQTHDWECPSLSPHVLLIRLDNFIYASTETDNFKITNYSPF